MNQTSQEQSPSGLSIAAIITGLLGMGIVAIILGAVDLSRIKRGESSEKGRGFDIAAIVLGAIETGILLIVIIICLIAFSPLWYYLYGV